MSYNGSYKTPDFTKDPGKTIQSQRDEADINKIIKRFEKTGTLPMVNKEPFYGDVSEYDGLATAIEKVQKAEQLFMEFDADIREKFDNDPVKMVDFLMDINNKQAAIDMGLIQPEVKAVVASAVTPEPPK